MADSYLTLADLTKINDKNLAEIEVTDLLDDAPFLRALAADVASNGTSHKYTKETGAPVVGFRQPNSGKENSASVDTLVSIDLKILDASFAVDKALAKAFHKGVDAYVAREAKRHLKAAFFGIERQLVNGTGQEADGFTGLADALGTLAEDMVVDAGGTANRTSVYLVRTNDDGVDCTAITGRDGQIEMGETVEQRLSDADGKHYTGLYTGIEGWMGLQIGSKYSVCRIANVGDGGTLTDDRIYEALALFPASRQPNLIVMNRTAQKQLRASRTATNATGAPAPRPTDVDGIPVVVTDAIAVGETAVA